MDFQRRHGEPYQYRAHADPEGGPEEYPQDAGQSQQLHDALHHVPEGGMDFFLRILGHAGEGIVKFGIFKVLVFYAGKFLRDGGRQGFGQASSQIPVQLAPGKSIG